MVRTMNPSTAACEVTRKGGAARVMSTSVTGAVSRLIDEVER